MNPGRSEFHGCAPRGVCSNATADSVAGFQNSDVCSSSRQSGGRFEPGDSGTNHERSSTVDPHSILIEEFRRESAGPLGTVDGSGVPPIGEFSGDGDPASDELLGDGPSDLRSNTSRQCGVGATRPRVVLPSSHQPLGWLRHPARCCPCRCRRPGGQESEPGGQSAPLQE